MYSLIFTVAIPFELCLSLYIILKIVNTKCSSSLLQGASVFFFVVDIFEIGDHWCFELTLVFNFALLPPD